MQRPRRSDEPARQRAQRALEHGQALLREGVRGSRERRGVQVRAREAHRDGLLRGGEDVHDHVGRCGCGRGRRGVCGPERRGHARGHAEGEGDERVRVEGDGAE